MTRKLLLVLTAGAAGLLSVARGTVMLPALFSDHMVLQQQQRDAVWGWDAPGTPITVTFAGQTQTTTAGADGKWKVTLAPLPATATPQVLSVRGSSVREIRDVLVGEVWVVSGQSNMGFALQQDVNGDLEAAASQLPGLRLIKVPQVGTQQLQDDFMGAWQLCTPTTAAGFSDVGLRFGRYLQQILGVPVGLIDNAWGGSSAEAWVQREQLERDPRFRAAIDATRKMEAEQESAAGKAQTAQALAAWADAVRKARAEGKPAPRKPADWMHGQARAGNLYAGVLHPIIGYGIKGVIWYQGESNAVRAEQYATLFSFLITEWRRDWGEGDFPFYWVQLPRYHARQTRPGQGGPWTELRDAQTAALKLPNTGQAITIDTGEGNNIHPRDKYNVAARLVRWPLARDYGRPVAYRSPEFREFRINRHTVRVTFACFGGHLVTRDVAEARGFVICGPDHVWRWAKAKVSGADTVDVWSDEVADPVAVRYAWADNPDCNLYSDAGLPVTPFRSDDFTLAAP